MKRFTDYRDYVGPLDRYPLVGISYRDFLDSRLPGWDEGVLLEVGCGGLRIGKELMPRLPKGAYFGIEPFTQVVEEALEREHGGRIWELFRPTFSSSDQFEVSTFGIHFPVIISYAVFIHCGRSQLNQFLANIRAHVDLHSQPTTLVLDLLIEDDPKELRPPSGETAYPHASHNASSYAAEEVPGMLARHGARLTVSDARLSCDGLGARIQHIAVFDAIS